MGFHLAANRIYIDDVNGDIVFDTNERMLICELVTGSKSLGQRQAASSNSVRSWSYTNDSGSLIAGSGIFHLQEDHVLGSINSHYDVVFGAYNISSAGYGNPVDTTGWWQASGGVISGGLFINNGTGGANPDGSPTVGSGFADLNGYVLYTFKASGGQLILSEDCFMLPVLAAGATVISSTVSATTIQYAVYVGSFN